VNDPEGVAQRLNKCLLCGSCAANCPSGVKALDIFLKARAILTGYMGLSSAKRLIFRGMLARPRLFDGLSRLAAGFQGLVSRPVNDIIGTSCARINTPLLADRHFRTLAPKPFHQMAASADTPAGESGRKAGFFVGCLIDKFFPSIGQAVITVFQHHGVGLFLPAGQACCGIPAISSGDRRTFEDLVVHNLKCFEAGRFDVLVTACATCTSTIQKVWPSLTTGLPAEVRRRVADLAAKTIDINAFLVDQVGVTANDADGADGRLRVTYHDPCHLKKSLGVASQPRTMIMASTGCELKEMTEADGCCGMGGSFNLQHYDISRQIGGRKAEAIMATGADVLATGCPACMLQIADALSQAGAKVAVRHPVELYGESLRANRTRG
jgi:glycolate oxidase iron-sulfur subunit